MLKNSVQKDYRRLQNQAKGYGKSIEEMLYLEYPEAFEVSKYGISKLGICEFFCLLFILYELVSILKNMTLCGLPVPSGVKKWIQKFLEDMTEELPEDAVKNIEIKTEPRTEGE